jgi:hypothetical protein
MSLAGPREAMGTIQIREEGGGGNAGSCQSVGLANGATGGNMCNQSSRGDRAGSC